MRVSDMREYKEMTKAIMKAKDYDQEQAEWALEEVMRDIEEGEASYKSAAEKLGLSSHLGRVPFDATDYLSRMI